MRFWAAICIELGLERGKFYHQSSRIVAQTEIQYMFLNGLDQNAFDWLRTIITDSSAYRMFIIIRQSPPLQQSQASRSMLNKLILMFRQKSPEFRLLHRDSIEPTLVQRINSSFFLTPRLQVKPYSEPLLKYVRHLQRSNTVNYDQMREFSQELILEYEKQINLERPELGVQATQKVYLPSSAACRYHGWVDWTYSSGGLNMVPVLFTPHQLNRCAGAAMAVNNMFYRLSLLHKLKERFPEEQMFNGHNHWNFYKSNKIYGYSIVTTGHQWQMFRVSSLDIGLEKSVVLQGRNAYRTLYHDQEMISNVLGMMDFCLDLPDAKVKMLEKAYQYLDEQILMLRGSTQVDPNDSPLVSRWLTQYFKKNS